MPTTLKRNIVPQVYKSLAAAVKREPKDIGKIVEDMRKDPVFTLGIRVLKSMAASAAVSFEVDGEDPRAERLAANLTSVWDRNIRQFLDAIEYGRQAFEIIHGDSRDINTVRDLVPIPFELSELEIDKETGKRGCLKVGKGANAVELIPQHYLWVTLDATEIEPYGRSRYRGAPFQVRQQRKDLDKQETTWYNRYSMGVGIARAPEEAIGPPISGDGDKGEVNVAGETIDPAKSLQDALEQLKAGGWMILSSATYPEGGQLKWDLTQFPDVKDGSAISSRRNHLDVAALRSLGIPERALIQEGQEGARALAEAHQLVLNDTVEEILRQVITAYQEQVINRMVMLNEINARITLTWKPLGDKSDQQTSELVRSVLTSSTPSPLITENVIDIVKLAESSGLPLGPDASGSLKRISEKSAAASGPQFGGFGGSFAQNLAHDIHQMREARLLELSQIAGGCC